MRKVILLCLLVACIAAGSTAAFAQFSGPQPLTLINGWTPKPFNTSIPTVEMVSGIVQFRGAMASSGTSAIAFTMPAGFAPAADVYIPVDLCNANNGRIHITPAGVVDVQTENGFSNAQCFTSLDGASFAPNSTGFTNLALINGWVNAPFSTSNAAVKKINGIVHFKGAIATSGTNSQPFVLPAAFRPALATDVYVPIDLCNANKGRLHITHEGVVDVQTENGTFSNAQCFTSLDGAWFMVGGFTGLRSLTPINGWVGAPFSTSTPHAGNLYGLVYFKGAIATGGTATQAFTLPTGLRPVTDVYVPVDLCNSNKGRILIQASGAVIVQAETSFSDAQCFTSLDGVSFVE